MKVKVHKVELLIVDHDDVGSQGVIDLLENTHYPNRAIDPDVKRIETVEIDWTDDHPLNRRDTAAAEYARLFGKELK